MLEIELSMIPDADVDAQVMRDLLADFSNKYGVKAKLTTMTWSTAWTDFITIASHGKGPDISHVGGTWVSSLAIMNALRPFAPDEIEEMGGAKAFLPATWQSGVLFGDDRVWSIPWTGYTYVVCYRKDLLAESGIEEESAFGTGPALLSTIKKIRKSSLEIPWLMPITPAPYSDLVHMAAAWIWEAGGAYIQETGEKVVFNEPAALCGLKAWMELYRMVPEAYAHLNQFESSSLFARGRAAVAVTDNRFATTIAASDAEEVVKKNLGVAPLTRVPWYGGGSFVIWRNTQGYPDRERATVQLVKHLTGKQAESRWGREVGSLPARAEVLRELYPPRSPLYRALTQSSESGRTYRPVALWHRLEYQIAQELNLCLQEARQDMTKELDEILHAHLDPLAERLNLTLRG